MNIRFPLKKLFLKDSLCHQQIDFLLVLGRVVTDSLVYFVDIIILSLLALGGLISKLRNQLRELLSPEALRNLV
jgi:hypothetical protein